MSQYDGPLYSFETRPTRQTRDRAEEMVATLLERLELSSEQAKALDEDDRELLLDFATNCHLNIVWYEASRRQQIRWYWGFALFTALVVVGTPIALLVPYGIKSSTLAAQVGVIIAGVLSAHRMLSSMFEKRNLVRHFWKAQADLKTLLYSLEDSWHGRAVADTDETPEAAVAGDEAPEAADAAGESGEAGDAPSTAADVAPALALRAEFRLALTEANRQARVVKGEEQDAFFGRYETAFSNLADIAGAVKTKTTEAVESLQAHRAEKQAPRVTAKAELVELLASRKAIADRLIELRVEYDGLANSTHEVEAARKVAIMRALEDLHFKDLETSLAVATTRARLEHLERSD